MNILFLTSQECTPFSGGIERFALVLGEKFEKDGHQVIYLAHKPFILNAPKGNRAEKNYILPYIRKIFVDENVLYLKNILKQFDIDIIFNQHADNCEFLNLCTNAKEFLPKVKLVSILHFSPCHHLSLFNISLTDSIKAKLSKSEVFSLVLRNSFIYKIKVRRTLRKEFQTIYSLSDAVVLLSEKFKKPFIDITKLNNTTKLSAISNPITNIVSNNIHNLKLNRILFVGRYQLVQKRCDLAIEVWKRICHKLPDWEFDMLGNGSYYEIAKKRIIDEHIPRINLRGFCKSDEYYAQSKILLLTSNSEGFGLVVTEAANYHIPTVAFNSFEAVTDVIIDGKTGYIVPPFNVDEYANKVLKLAKNETLLTTMGAQAYQHVQNFNIDIIAKQWYELFKKLINCPTNESRC